MKRELKKIQKKIKHTSLDELLFQSRSFAPKGENEMIDPLNKNMRYDGIKLEKS